MAQFDMSSQVKTPEQIEFDKKMQELELKMQQIAADQAAAQAERAKFADMYGDAVKSREKDFEAGRKRGEELFGEGKLGRLEEGRSAEIADLIERRKQNLAGFSQEEQNALRDQNMANIQRGAAAQARQLRSIQARSGVRGATAAAQQMALQKQNQQAMTEAERDLFLRQADAKRAALGDYSKDLGGARAEELGRQTFNIDQKNKESYGKLNTEMGYASLGAADRAAINQRLIGEKQVQAAQQPPPPSGGGGKK